jgi:mannose-6-phosphate isomerase
MGQRILSLETQYHERVWGGQQLLASDPPIGEAWVAMGESRVRNGPLAGRLIRDIATEFGAELLGTSVFARYGPRFPLLAKILDPADWLSIQVHPNDEQARTMVGPDEFGKTEAWYFLSTGKRGQILLGVQRGIPPFKLAAAIRERRVIDVAERVEVHDGEAILIPAGTLHALGPGLLLFEIQQASDTTYRAYDWGRPETASRHLHIEESVQVTTTAGPQPGCTPVIVGDSGTADAVDCEYFDLDIVKAAARPMPLDTGRRSFHILTAIQGAAEIATGDETVLLEPFDTVVVAGGTGQYAVRAVWPNDSTRLARVAVPT